MNAISFSLYAAEPNRNSGAGDRRLPHEPLSVHYQTGAVRNAQLIGDIYPGWKMVVYCESSLPRETINALEKNGAEMRFVDGCSMFHRFLINDDPAVERYLVRDADSRLNAREARAVAEWIESGKSFHVIRDHPHHPQPIMGGMWGGVTGKINMAGLLQGQNLKERHYWLDMKFLAEKVWPVIKEDALQHDLCTWRQYPGAKHFKASFDDMRFCGEVYLADDQPRKGDWERRINWMTA